MALAAPILAVLVTYRRLVSHSFCRLADLILRPLPLPIYAVILWLKLGKSDASQPVNSIAKCAAGDRTIRGDAVSSRCWDGTPPSPPAKILGGTHHHVKSRFVTAAAGGL